MPSAIKVFPIDFRALTFSNVEFAGKLRTYLLKMASGQICLG